jgi:predicted ATPase
MGKKEKIEFLQKMVVNGSPGRFSAENMSDGTLSAVGILRAVFQSFPAENSPGMPLVGIEEPELALHPGAAGVLRDALGIASRHAQILVTSHSPDLLDDKSISDRNILAVINRNGETIIGPITDKDRDAIRDRLFTAGELLRLGELTPDVEKIHQTPAQELELFRPTGCPPRLK